MYKPEDNFEELYLFHAAPRTWSQVVSLGSQHLCLLILSVHCYPSKQTQREMEAVNCRRRPGYKLQSFGDELLNVPVCRLHMSLLDQVCSHWPQLYTHRHRKNSTIGQYGSLKITRRDLPVLAQFERSWVNTACPFWELDTERVTFVYS